MTQEAKLTREHSTENTTATLDDQADLIMGGTQGQKLPRKSPQNTPVPSKDGKTTPKAPKKPNNKASEAETTVKNTESPADTQSPQKSTGSHGDSKAPRKAPINTENVNDVEGSTPLVRRKYERFCQLLADPANTLTQVECYRRAISTKGTRHGQQGSASRLANRPDIKARIAFLERAHQSGIDARANKDNLEAPNALEIIQELTVMFKSHLPVSEKLKVITELREILAIHPQGEEVPEMSPDQLVAFLDSRREMVLANLRDKGHEAQITVLERTGQEHVLTISAPEDVDDLKAKLFPTN